MEINHCVTPQTTKMCRFNICLWWYIMSLFEKFKKVLFEEEDTADAVVDILDKTLLS